MIKKIISVFLQIVLPKKIFEKRHQSYLFQIYNKFELFLRSLKLRKEKLKFIFLPVGHIFCSKVYEEMLEFIKIEKLEIFLFGGSLLGVARNQGGSAGSAKDLDIGIVIKESDLDNTIIILKSYFGSSRLKFNNDNNSVHIHFPEFQYYADLSFFFIKKNKVYHKSTYPYPKVINLNKSDIFPFKKKIFYKMPALIPNKTHYILVQLFGENWIKPNKKKQIYI